MASMDTTILDAFSPGRQRLYRECIEVAQGGQHDNDYKRHRYYLLQQLVQSALDRLPGLDLVECGCWHGHSTLMIANLMRGWAGRLHVFDSFEGLSEFGSADRSPFIKDTDRERVAFASDFERLRKLTAPFGCVDLHKGWIPDVFVGVSLGPIAFASIDVDLYEPTKACLEHLYPRLAPGGILYLDDYGYKTFPGAQKAADEYLASVSPTLFIRNPAGSAFVVR